METLSPLLNSLRRCCEALPELRRPGPNTRYAMADFGLAAFSVFFMQSPSFLGHQRTLAEGHGRSNCQTLFGMAAIPSDNHIRQMLDGNSPAAFDRLFLKGLETTAAADGLAPFKRLGGRLLVALDGTEHFGSRKLGCPQCSARRRNDGGTEYFHAFLGASVVAPGHTQVLPLPPEFIAPQDGAEKQDCERAAAKHWLARHAVALARFRPVYLGDDLYACQPIAQAIRDTGGNFILTCKPGSHQTITEDLTGVDLQEHRQVVVQRGKRITHVYRWLTKVPLRGTADAVTVNWFSVEVLNGSSTAGLAQQAAERLQARGWRSVRVGNAGRVQANTTVETRPGLSRAGQAVSGIGSHGYSSLLLLVMPWPGRPRARPAPGGRWAARARTRSRRRRKRRPKPRTRRCNCAPPRRPGRPGFARGSEGNC